MDARTLAKAGEKSIPIVRPVRHRSAKAQIHLTAIRARATLVSAVRHCECRTRADEILR